MYPLAQFSAPPWRVIIRIQKFYIIKQRDYLAERTKASPFISQKWRDLGSIPGGHKTDIFVLRFLTARGNIQMALWSYLSLPELWQWNHIQSYIDGMRIPIPFTVIVLYAFDVLSLLENGRHKNFSVVATGIRTGSCKIYKMWPEFPDALDHSAINHLRMCLC